MAPDTTAETAPSAARPDKALSYAEKKERERITRRARKRVEEAEAAIEKLETEIAAMEERMAAGEYSDELMTTHADTRKRLDNAMSEWELAQADLDALA